jgi:hypothetical protein
VWGLESRVGWCNQIAKVFESQWLKVSTSQMRLQTAAAVFSARWHIWLIKCSPGYYLLESWPVQCLSSKVPRKSRVHRDWFLLSPAAKPPDNQRPMTSPEPRGSAWPKSSALRGCVGDIVFLLIRFNCRYLKYHHYWLFIQRY